MKVLSRYWMCAALLLLATADRAQTPAPVLPHAGLPALKNVSVAEYRTHLLELRGLVLACQRDAAACDPARVGDDDSVSPPGGRAYVERFGWLRDLLDARTDSARQRRTALLPLADLRLQQQLAETDEPVASPAGLTPPMQAARAAVLSRKEFRMAQDYSLRERLTAWFSDLLMRMFGGVSSLGRMAPWLGTALEWGTLLLTASLLLLWAYRTLERQRVTLGKIGELQSYAERQAESRAWAQRAREHAARANWRDAVHALYWASIVVLEDRRTLRRSGTRTPREALRLIDPASHLREPLRAQTAEFERIWYGLHPAAAADYEAAMSYYTALSGAHSGNSTA